MSFDLINKNKYKPEIHYSLCKEISSYIKEGAISEEDKNDLPSDLIQWDFIFIDEAQDFHENEKDLLFQLFDYKKIIVADGMYQYIRDGRTDWTNNIDAQIINENKCLRQKKNLAQFVYAYAEKHNINWSKKCLDEFTGGKIIIDNSYIPIEKIKQLRQDCVNEGNEPYEVLFLSPPSLSDPDKGFKKINIFNKNGIKCWDGTKEENRSNDILCNLKKHRILTYDSCRGLEGWLVICLGLDEFIRWKKKNCRDNINHTNPMISEEDIIDEYVAQWVLMALTRAIDTILITLKDNKSREAKNIIELAEQYPDLIEIS